MQTEIRLIPKEDFDIKKLVKESDEIQRQIASNRAEYLRDLQENQIRLAQDIIDSIVELTEKAKAQNKREFELYHQKDVLHEQLVRSLQHGVDIKEIEIALYIITRSCESLNFAVEKTRKADGVTVRLSW